MNEAIDRTVSVLLKARDVAEVLNISRALAYQLMRTGELPSVKMGNSVRVIPEDLQEYIRSHRSGN